MYFHAYVPLILSILILICVGTFLFLSLSLSLRLACSMAPKRKFTSSQNALHFGAASSSPSHVWFSDEKARTDFLENFSRRSIHSERQVVLSDFSDTDIPTVIYSRS